MVMQLIFSETYTGLPFRFCSNLTFWK